MPKTPMATRRTALTMIAFASAICAGLSAAVSARELWPIMSAYGPLCGETSSGALLHCPACYLAIGFTLLAMTAALLARRREPARPAR